MESISSAPVMGSADLFSIQPGAISSGPPYLPSTSGLGGHATVGVDVPISAVFIAMFIFCAVGHMTVFQRNRRRGHKFIPSVATFGFCMARITASVLRIAGATRPTNINLAIAGQVFVAAGVLILFILNLLFAQRMLRASQPRFGWSRPVSIAFKALYLLIFLTLVMLIAATVKMFFTLDPDTRRVCRDLQLYGASFFTFVTFLPLPIVAYACLAPRHQPIDPFGTGKWTTKAKIVGVSGVLLCMGAGFRLGTSAMPARAITNPAWYHHKACFYIFNFGLEVVVAYMWLVFRFDRRFYIPDGSSKVRNYSRESTSPAEPITSETGKTQDEKEARSKV